MEESKNIEPGNKQDKHKGTNPRGVNIRTEKELAEDLLLICKYRKQGIGWRTIAQKINNKRDYELSFSVYYTQYHDAKSSIQREALENKDDLIEAELSEINWQIAELMTAWTNSIGTMTKEATNEKNGLTITTWEENGDPRYMAEITKLRERRAKLLDLDSATKIKVEDSEALRKLLEGLTPEELAKLKNDSGTTVQDSKD